MQKRQTTKTRVANQIYRDPWGFEVRVKCGGKLYPKRYPDDTPLYVMQRWQLDTADGLRKKAALIRRKANDLELAPLDSPPAATVTGTTMEARLDVFFPQIQGRVSFKADRSHLRAWLTAPGADGVPLGAKAPAMISTADINVVINAWRMPTPAGKPGHLRALRRIAVTAYTRNGHAINTYKRKTPTTSGPFVVAVRTVRHRCRLLKEFLVSEDVPTNAIDQARIPALEHALPLGVELQTIRAVAIKLATTDWRDTYGRYLVLNTTAQRPAQLMRAQPGDVKLETGLWIVRSAKGAPAHTITLNSEMVKAWRVFMAANAWGIYDTSLHAKRLRVCGWPAAIRPYNARHSVIQDALQNYGVHLDDAQGLAGHAKAETTRQFYGPLALDRQRHISKKLEGRMKAVFDPRPRQTVRSLHAMNLTTQEHFGTAHLHRLWLVLQEFDEIGWDVQTELTESRCHLHIRLEARDERTRAFRDFHRIVGACECYRLYETSANSPIIRMVTCDFHNGGTGDMGEHIFIQTST